jgi:hypothetical protein
MAERNGHHPAETVGNPLQGDDGGYPIGSSRDGDPDTFVHAAEHIYEVMLQSRFTLPHAQRWNAALVKALRHRNKVVLLRLLMDAFATQGQDGMARAESLFARLGRTSPEVLQDVRERRMLGGILDRLPLPRPTKEV